VITNSLNVNQNQYTGLVSLESGTNQVELLASDAAGNTSSNTYTIISATEFSGAITNPVFGAFATTPSNYVSGYVSALYDAGLPTQTNITTVTINGVAAVLGTNQDAYGNVPFWTTNMIPLGVPITGVVGGPGVPTDSPSLPPVQSQVYEVTAKTTVYDLVPYDFDEEDGALRPTYVCGGSWFVYTENAVISNEFDLSGGEDSVVVDEYRNTRFNPSPGFLCTGDPANDPSLWGPWSGFEYQETYTDTNPVRSLAFGSFLRAADWHPDRGAVGSQPYEVYIYGSDSSAETYWPWENQIRASLTFTAPQQYGTNITVIFTFEGMQYTTPAGMTQDLSQVQFRGQSPVSNDTTSVSYLLSVTGCQSYTINQDDFQWPSFTTNYIQQYPYATEFYSDTLHNLSWTNFHNHSPVHILWTNNVDITGTSGNSIIVGQQVNLTATVDTPGIATSNFTWSVSGYAMSNYVFGSSFSSAQALPLVQTNNATISYYWVSGGQQNVTCSVLLNNGSIATSQAGFTVQRPQQQIGTGTGTVTANSGSLAFVGPGITFLRVGDSNIYGGSNYWEQVIVSSSRWRKQNGGTCFGLSVTNNLDTEHPYSSNPNITDDSPSITFFTNYLEVAAADNFCMWLMYTPPGTNSVPVPLRAVRWNWSGDAIQTNGVWQLISGSGSAAPDNDTNGFPTWTGVVSGSTPWSSITCP
jgi:hypothetical protein